MGCLVEARITAASRWSLIGTVTAVLFSPPGAAPVAIAPDLAQGAGGDPDVRSCSSAEAGAAARSGRGVQPGWAAEGASLAGSPSNEASEAYGFAGSTGGQPWEEPAAAEPHRGFQAGEAAERPLDGGSAEQGPEQASGSADQEATAPQPAGTAAEAAVAALAQPEGTPQDDWQLAWAEMPRRRRPRLEREEGLRQMMELTGSSYESCAGLLDSLLEDVALADQAAADAEGVGAEWAGASRAHGAAEAAGAGHVYAGMAGGVAPWVHRFHWEAIHVLGVLWCVCLLLGLSGILSAGVGSSSHMRDGSGLHLPSHQG